MIDQLLTHMQDGNQPAEEDLDMMAGIKSEAVGAQFSSF